MAKKDKGEVKKGAGVPEGFTPVNAAGNAAWFKPDLGVPVLGELLGRFRKKKSLDPNKEAWFYQVMVERETLAFRKLDPDDDAVEVKLPPGSLINVDERSALEELANLVESSGKRWRVYIEPLNKVPVPGTVNTVWRFNVGKQEIIPGKNEPTVKLISDVPF